MRLPIAVVVALAVTLGIPGSAATADDGEAGVSWRTDPDAALAEAESGSRPVLVDVFAEWCQPCRYMERATYGDAAVIRATSAFVALRLDADSHGTFANRYAVDVLPSTLVLEPNGRLVTAVGGVVEAGPMADLLTRVARGWSTYRDDAARPGDPEAQERAASFLAGIGNPEGAARALNLAAMTLRANRAPAERVQVVEVKLARARLENRDWPGAQSEFERLAREGVVPEVRAMALAGWAATARERGRVEEADRLLERLRSEYPDLADRIAR